MIKIIREEDFWPDLKKDIHYISWTPYSTMSNSGYASLSWVFPIVSQAVPGVDIVELFRTIDRKNETGTLFPVANITIMPSLNQPYSDEEIYKHFSDAMKAQNMYIHAENVIFDMRFYSYLNPHTNQDDDEEYLYMIDQSAKLDNVVSDKKMNVYVILTRDIKLKFRNVDYKLATKDEINFLGIDQKHG